MTNSTMRKRLLASSMISGVALAAASATGAYAQSTSSSTAATTPASTVGELVVTGSRIPQPNLTSIAPVTSVGNQELKLEGTQRVEDLVNQLPQVIADQGGNLANGATGTADISLRDLGPQRTLVLIDGRRLVPGDPAFPYPDINFIPAALIDRVEVDLAGASAVYGSDAVAGVVNFIMKRDFEGVRLDVNYGVYQNNNGNTAAQAANTAKGFTAPTGSVFDGNAVDVTAIFGVNSPDGKGNVEGYVSYRHIDPVLQASRDYSFCNEQLSKNVFVCAGSGTLPGGQFIPFNAAGTNTTGDFTLDTAHPGNLRPKLPTDTFNFAPFNYFQRPDERYSGGFFAHYDINPMFQAYSEFMFMDDHTVAQIAPSGIFGQTEAIPCSDPLLSAQEKMVLCTNGGLTPAQNAQVIILRRNVEGGNRQDDLRHTDYRAVVGLRGDLNSNWHYDIYGQYGASILSEEYLNDVSKVRTARALNVVTDPKTGQPVCQSVLDGTDPLCVPYNIWTPGGVTPAQTAYLSVPGFQEGQDTEQVVSGSITGNLGDYGLKSPMAHDGIGVALGAEYRRESLRFQVDQEFSSGDLAGQGAALQPVSGAFDVKEFFAEARVPLVQDAPFFKSLDLELGYRFSHYSSSGDASAYKVAGDWAINDDIRIRGGFNRTVRAPNVIELFTPQHLQLDGTSDNCSGATPVFTAAQCANTGVSAAQYGRILPNPAAQYNGITGGNPLLKPEIGSTYSLGIVLTPHEFISGLSFSADYFNVKITNVIQSVGADNILNNCATAGLFCNLVHRAPVTGSLWLGTNGFITDTTQNLGFLKTSGVDFGADYHTSFHDMGMGDFGGIALSFLGTYTHDYQVQGPPGSALLNCVGNFGLTCQGTATPETAPLPHFRAKTRLTWTTPFDGIGLSIAWRYIGPVNLDRPANQNLIDAHIESYNYFDLAATWRVRDRYTFRAGVNNIFDRDPPIIGQGELPGIVGSGNTYPELWDPLGRYIFVGLTADF
ncbi:MAG TPA: TonB-dependent receptor [Caulobacteraceae bacterium]